MKQLLTSALLASILGLAGCSGDDHKTIEWYDQHPEARADKLKWCAVDGVSGAVERKTGLGICH